MVFVLDVGAGAGVDEPELKPVFEVMMMPLVDGLDTPEVMLGLTELSGPELSGPELMGATGVEALWAESEEMALESTDAISDSMDDSMEAMPEMEGRAGKEVGMVTVLGMEMPLGTVTVVNGLGNDEKMDAQNKKEDDPEHTT